MDVSLQMSTAAAQDDSLQGGKELLRHSAMHPSEQGELDHVCRSKGNWQRAAVWKRTGRRDVAELIPTSVGDEHAIKKAAMLMMLSALQKGSGDFAKQVLVSMTAAAILCHQHTPGRPSE